jgi:hypothetical protein
MMKPNPSFAQTSNKQGATPSSVWLYGTVRSVEPTRELLFLQLPKAEKEQIIHWLPETRFLNHGAEVKSNALHVGQQVSVQYSNDGSQNLALEIDIVAESNISPTTAQRQSFWPLRKEKP